MSEDDFWSSSLRKITSLAEVHIRVNSNEKSERPMEEIKSNGEKITRGKTEIYRKIE